MKMELEFVFFELVVVARIKHVGKFGVQHFQGHAPWCWRHAAGQQLVRDAIAALVKQTGAIEQAAGKLGISDLNPDTADHSF